MGTRSLTYVYNEEGNKIINMYRQYDGYPTGHGAELAEFLNSGRVVNGLDGIGKERQFNGSGCLAAQLVAHFKGPAGQFYLYPTTSADCGQDYEYHIFTEGELFIKIVDRGINMFGMTQSDINNVIFSGNLAQFTKYCSNERYGDEEINTPKNVFDNSSLGQDWLKSCLRDGEVSVVFEKNDGTERTMRCTLSADIIPLFDTTGVTVVRKKAANTKDVLAVWDIEANGWRSFRYDSIKSVEIGAMSEDCN